MTPERWQQIDHLFHETLACEPALRENFLAAACESDDSLRVEVESLLSSHHDASEFIETPAGDVAAEMLGARPSTFEPGQKIENYRIIRLLGTGGMGEVYLADDARLNRKVALKLLPPHFTSNPDRVRRFEREARAASALNHPNIVTIYEIGKSASVHFIATEFVDGKTLRQLINENPFKLSETLNVAIQVAGALVGATLTPHGMVEANPYDVMQYRATIGARHVKMIAEIDSMHFQWFGGKPLVEVARAAKTVGADAVSLCNPDEEVTLQMIRDVKRALPGLPVILAGYTNHANAARMLAEADGAFVGTCLERDGWGGTIDIERVREYVAIVASLR